MIHRLIAWALVNRLVVILSAVALTAFGIYAFLNINVEAYPDPAPAIIEVIAQYPGASAEEVERQVTIPLEIALAGMPGLDYTRSKIAVRPVASAQPVRLRRRLFRARLEVLNRLNSVDLPPGVKPEIAPTSPTGEIYRYMLREPERRRRAGTIYTLNDLKSLQRLEAGEGVSPRAADRRRRELRRRGEALRDSARPGPAASNTASRSSNWKRPSPRATPTSAATTCGRETRCRRCAGWG